MLKENDYLRDYLGVSAWHKAGYTGGRVKIASAEDFASGKPGTHVYDTYFAAKEIAPLAAYTYVPFLHGNGKTDAEVLADAKDNLTDTQVLFSALNCSGFEGVDAMFASLPELSVLWAAGNDSTNSAFTWIEYESVWGVGAVNVGYDTTVNGKPTPTSKIIVTPENYSSESKHVDFCSATIYSESGRLRGTSFATPVLAGMCALVQDFFMDKIGRFLNRQEMYDFLKENCVDVADTGKDSKTGWGFVRLPDPYTVDYRRYDMAKTNTGLVQYAAAQLGRPYWFGTCGQMATREIYEMNKARFPAYYAASDFPKQYGQRVHDCSGLIEGYLMSDGPDSPPVYNGKYDLSANRWLEVAKESGKIATIPELPGVLVHMPNHIGIYIGNGYVIEARGHAYGVVMTKLKDRPWLNWSLCPFIEYEESDDMAKFADIQNHWAKTYIEKCADAGLVNGKTADKFYPDASMTRAEVCAVMARLMDKMGVK